MLNRQERVNAAHKILTFLLQKGHSKKEITHFAINHREIWEHCVTLAFNGKEKSAYKIVASLFEER